MRHDVRSYLFGLTFSTIGDHALSLVAGIWVDALTGSARDAGLVSVAVYLPSLASPLAGALADRVRRRRLLVIVDLLAAAVVLVLLAVRGAGQVWLIYTVMIGYGVVLAVTDPAETALFVALVPDADQRASLNGQRLAIAEAGRFVAPLGGAALYVAVGGGAVAALDAATFLVAAVVTARLQTADPRPTQQPVDLGAGARHLRGSVELRRTTAVAGLAILVSGVGVAAQFALVAALHRSPAFNGVLAGCLGAGSVVGGLTAGPMIRRIGEARLLQLSLVNGVVSFALLAVGSLPPTLLGSLLRGVALPWTLVAALSLTQRLTPDALQGRTSAAQSLLLFGPTPLALVAGSLLVGSVGYRGLFGGAAVATAFLLAVPPVTARLRPRSAPDRAAR